jgi:hypothetical protein
MKDAQGAHVQGRTRWRRFGLAAIPAVAAVGILGFMMQQGALAASFAVSGNAFTVTATELDGTGFSQFGTVDASASGDHFPVAVSGIASAKLYNMCQLVTTPNVPFVGTVYLKLTAGQGTTPVSATDLTVDANQLSGDASFTKIDIGVDASKLTKGGAGGVGTAGGFGQQADGVVIKNLHQIAYATSAGTFELPGLNLSVSTSPVSCP